MRSQRMFVNATVLLSGLIPLVDRGETMDPQEVDRLIAERTILDEIDERFGTRLPRLEPLDLEELLAPMQEQRTIVGPTLTNGLLRLALYAVVVLQQEFPTTPENLRPWSG